VFVDPSLAGLRGAGLGSGYCAGLCKPGECGPVEQRSYVYGLQVLQALRACPGRAEIMQACADLGGMAQWNRDCVWISCIAGFGDMSQQSRDCAGLCRPEGMARQRS
jgi:hypothetical protein